MAEQTTQKNSPCERLSDKKNKMTIATVSSALAVGGASALWSHHKKNGIFKTLGFFAGGVALSAIPLVAWYRSAIDKKLIDDCEIERTQDGVNRRFTVNIV